jgi:hypothetical protein
VHSTADSAGNKISVSRGLEVTIDEERVGESDLPLLLVGEETPKIILKCSATKQFRRSYS